MHELIEKLLKKHIPSVETTEQQFSDRLDFHDVHIQCLVDLVKDAVARGMEIGMNAMSKD